MQTGYHKTVGIPAGQVTLFGELFIPEKAKAVIIFSHGSGSSRFSTRNQQVAQYLNARNFGTLLFDLLTEKEDREYANRFNINLLTSRLKEVTEWLQQQEPAKNCQIGFFGASTGAASALKAAAVLPQVQAVVSRGGRADLAMQDLPKVEAATLLIVGSLDHDVLQLNKAAYKELNCIKKLEVIQGASHLFEEEGTMEKVCQVAGEWFITYLQPAEVNR